MKDGHELAALRREIAEEQAELRTAVADLERAAKAARQSLRPGEWIRRRPWTLLGSGFLVGVWLGARG